MASAKTTIDHEEIKRYVEERDGKPARVKGTEDNGGGSGVLRIDFPAGTGEDKFEHISWDEFFKDFDDNNLAMLYQEETKDGQESRFVRFVNRENDSKSDDKKSSTKKAAPKAKKSDDAATEKKATASKAKKEDADEKKADTKKTTAKAADRKPAAKKTTGATAKKSTKAAAK